MNLKNCVAITANQMAEILISSKNFEEQLAKMPKITWRQRRKIKKMLRTIPVMYGVKNPYYRPKLFLWLRVKMCFKKIYRLVAEGEGEK